MKKKLSKLMYIIMTSVLLFSMIATNIAIVTANKTDIISYEELKELAETYEAKSSTIKNPNEYFAFQDVLKAIYALENADKESEDYQNKVNAAYNSFLPFKQLIDSAEEMESIKEEKLLLDGEKEKLQQLYDQLAPIANDDEDNYYVNQLTTFKQVLEEVAYFLEQYASYEPAELVEQVTQEEITAQYENLQNAYATLQERKKGDISDLENYYLELSEKSKDQYTSTSWQKLVDQLEDTQDFIQRANQYGATQTDVNKALQALQEATQALETKGNIRSLESDYQRYTKYKEETYTASSWGPFETVLEEVGAFIQAFKINEDVSQQTIDQKHVALNDAAKKLETRGDPKALEDAYHKALEDRYIDEHEEVEKYTLTTWKTFEKTLEAIAAFLNDEEALAEATRNTITEKLTELQNAKNLLRERGNVSALENKYNEVKTYDPISYTQKSWQAFATALKETEKFLTDDSENAARHHATQNDVDKILSKLNRATSELVKRGDTTALRNAYNKYVKYNELDYTSASWEPFEKILKEIAGFLDGDADNPNLTVKEVQRKIALLEDAQYHLVKKGDTKKLKEIFTTYEQEEPKNYTRSSWQPFAKVLEETRHFLNSGSILNEVTQAEVDEVLKDLQTVYQNLDKRGDISELQTVHDHYMEVLNKEDDYTRSTWQTYIPPLETALAAAKDFLAKAGDEAVAADISQATIDAEKAKLMDIYEKLDVRGDIILLEERHAQYVKELAEKREEGIYTTESLDALALELESMETEFLTDEDVLADANQAAVDAQLARLEAVYEQIEARGKIKALKKKHAEITKALEKNKEKYTPRTVNMLQEELTNVQEAYLKGNESYADASQAKLDAALANLTRLYDALAERGDASKLTTLHTDYLNINQDKYTKTTKEKFAKAMDEIAAFLSDSTVNDATQEEIDLQFKKLKEHREQLIEKGDIAGLQDMFNKYNRYAAEDYNAGTWKIFRENLDQVSQLLENTDARENASHEKVAEMKELLKSAVDQLEKAPVDFTSLKEAYENLTNEFSEADIKKYMRDDKKAKAILAELAEIEDYFTNKQEEATNKQAKKYEDRIKSIHQDLLDGKKLLALEEEHGNFIKNNSKNDVKKYKDELTEIEAYLQGNHGDVTDEKTQQYLDRLKEMEAEIAQAKTEAKKQNEEEKKKKEEEVASANKEAKDQQVVASTKDDTAGGASTPEEGMTLSDTVDQLKTDPIGALTDARDKYILPHTASDNYKYVVTGILMLVEGLFLYGYFRFFSYLRTRFDLF